jgi:hypothetical protein
VRSAICTAGLAVALAVATAGSGFAAPRTASAGDSTQVTTSNDPTTSAGSATSNGILAGGNPGGVNPGGGTGGGGGGTGGGGGGEGGGEGGGVSLCNGGIILLGLLGIGCTGDGIVVVIDTP